MNTEASGKVPFYVLLATIVIAPLAFVPTQFFGLESVKVIVIALGVLAALVFLGLEWKREGAISIPPRALAWAGGAIMLTAALSALLSTSPAKSFFGQGFEIGTASFLLLLFVGSWVSYAVVKRHPERAVVMYAGMTAAFLILYIFHALRFILGPEAMTFSILSSLTSSPFGSWTALGVFALLVVIVASVALIYLPLSRRMRIAYGALAAVAAFGAMIINNTRSWEAAAVVFLGLAIFAAAQKVPLEGAGRARRLLSRIAWVPVALFIIAAAFALRGGTIAGPLITKIGAVYQEVSPSWQLTVDVAADAVKNDPLFGVGPNRFGQAYLAYKPLSINSTGAWAFEFNSGFGFLPTLVVTQGVIGAIAWIVFFVFFGIYGARSLRRLPEAPHARFIVVSSFAGAVFLWIVASLYMPTHTLIFYAFLLTGIWAGASVAYGSLVAPDALRPMEGKMRLAFAIASWAIIVVGAAWGVWSLKKTAAFAFFGSGVRELNVESHPDIADNKFRMALTLDPSDVYWRARAEAGMIGVQRMLSEALAQGSTLSQADADAVGAAVNQTISYAQKAVAYDRYNYYNHVSEARVSELAVNLKMERAYENALASYSNAVALNPGDPSLYLSVARLHASQNKLDLAVQAVGAALQIKNNYLDAVYLLSQIEAARGNIDNAVVAARYAVQLNPNNPLLLFQLGLLQYTGKDYAGAVESLSAAVAAQPDYANAQYFLGLAQAYSGKRADAIAQFAALSESNPDNSEVKLILANLQAGRQPFASAASSTPAPEKRSSLPVKEKSR